MFLLSTLLSFSLIASQAPDEKNSGQSNLADVNTEDAKAGSEAATTQEQLEVEPEQPASQPVKAQDAPAPKTPDRNVATPTAAVQAESPLRITNDAAWSVGVGLGSFSSGSLGRAGVATGFSIGGFQIANAQLSVPTPGFTTTVERRLSPNVWVLLSGGLGYAASVSTSESAAEDGTDSSTVDGSGQSHSLAGTIGLGARYQFNPDDRVIVSAHTTAAVSMSGGFSVSKSEFSESASGVDSDSTSEPSSNGWGTGARVSAGGSVEARVTDAISLQISMNVASIDGGFGMAGAAVESQQRKSDDADLSIFGGASISPSTALLLRLRF